MLRKIALFILTMAVVAAGFELHRRVAGTGRGLPAVEPLDEDELPETPLDAGAGFATDGGGGLQAARRFWMLVSDASAGTVRTLYFDEFEPDPSDSRRAVVRNILFRVHNLKRGTFGYLLADRAEFVGDNLEGGNAKIDEGLFVGNVELRYDRNGDTSTTLATARFRRSMFWRGRRPMLQENAALSEAEADDMLLRSNRLHFREAGRWLRIEGELSILSREFYLRGRHLQMRWTHVGQDVQLMHLEQGDRLVWYDGNNRLGGFMGSEPPRPGASSGATTALAAPRRERGFRGPMQPGLAVPVADGTQDGSGGTPGEGAARGGRDGFAGARARTTQLTPEMIRNVLAGRAPEEDLDLAPDADPAGDEDADEAPVVSNPRLRDTSAAGPALLLATAARGLGEVLLSSAPAGKPAPGAPAPKSGGPAAMKADPAAPQPKSAPPTVSPAQRARDLHSYLITFRRNVVIDASGNGLILSALGGNGEFTLDIDLFNSSDESSDNPLFQSPDDPGKPRPKVVPPRVVPKPKSGDLPESLRPGDARAPAPFPRRPGGNTAPRRGLLPVSDTAAGNRTEPSWEVRDGNPRHPEGGRGWKGGTLPGEGGDAHGVGLAHLVSASAGAGAPGAKPGASAPTTPTAPPARRPPPPRKTRPVIITWQGPMTVRAQEAHAGPAGLLPDHKYVRITAVGDPVIVVNEAGRVDSTAMTADAVGSWVVFRAEDGIVRMTYKDGSTVVGRQLIARPARSGDPDMQQVLVYGPGRLRGRSEGGSLGTLGLPTSDSAASGTAAPKARIDPNLAEFPADPHAEPKPPSMLEADFRDSLTADLRWLRRIEPVRDPATGEPRYFRGIPLLSVRKQLTPVRFSLYEDVHIRSPEWSVKGMEAVLRFTAPETWADPTKPVPERMEIHHNVDARRESDILLADHLELPVKQDVDGRFYVPQMIATGRIRGRQAGTDLQAEETLTVTLSKQPRPGVTGPDGKPATKWAPERFEAKGKVRVRDGAQSVDARGDRIAGSLLADAAILFGSPETPASAVQKKGDQDTVITSPDRIILHRFRGGLRADIEGSGTVSAWLAPPAGPDGKPIPEAKPGRMNLRWAEGLEYIEDPTLPNPGGRVTARGKAWTSIRRSDAGGSTFEEEVTGRTIEVLIDLRKPQLLPEVITDAGGTPRKDPAATTGRKPDPGLGGLGIGGAGGDGDGDGESARRPRTLIVEGDVWIKSHERSAEGGSRLFQLDADRKVIYDVPGKRLDIPGGGRMGMWERKFEPDPVTKAPVEKETQGGFRWERSMVWDQPTSRMDLKGNVFLVGRGTDGPAGGGLGGAIGGPLGGGASAKAATKNQPKADVPVSRLNTEELTVWLADRNVRPAGAPEPAATADAGVAGRGFSSVRRFEARGKVRYQEGIQTASGDTAVYERRPARDGGDVEILVLRGSQGRPAELLEADPKRDDKYSRLAGDVLVGKRNKQGDMYFRADNAAGTAGGN